MRNWLFLIVLLSFSCETHLHEFDYELTGETPGVKTQLDTSNFIIWYPFTGNSSDESGNGLDAVVYEATLDQDRHGEENSSYKFDISDEPGLGEKDDILITKYNNLMDVESFTLFAWVKPKIKTSIYEGRPSTIMARWDGDKLGKIFRFQVLSDGRIKLQIGENKSFYSNHSISYNEWNHVAVSYDEKNIKFYINSILVDSIQTDVDITLSPSHLTIGETWMENGYWLKFNGNIDDVGISNGALDSIEINNLYNL